MLSWRIANFNKVYDILALFSLAWFTPFCLIKSACQEQCSGKNAEPRIMVDSAIIGHTENQIYILVGFTKFILF